MERDKYLNKFKRCILEYTSLDGRLEEDDPMAGAAPSADPMSAGASPSVDPMAAGASPGVDPMAAGTAPAADPMAAGAAPGADQMAAGTAPAADTIAAGAAPMNPEQEAATDNATGGPITPNNGEGGNDDSENKSSDNSDDSNSETNEKVENVDKNLEKLTSKFDSLMSKLDSFEQKINDSNEKIERLKIDMDKRNPSPEERISLRTRHSGPYTETVDDYWDEKEATSNYSTNDDNNGVDMPKYKITKSEIDNINDWANISKSFDDERMGLKDIFGY